MDIVYLKDGRQQTGEMISYNKGQFLVLVQSDGNELHIMDSLIARIHMGVEAVHPDNSVEKKRNNRIELPAKGLFISPQIVLAPGLSKDDELLMAALISTKIGYQWDTNWSTAAGFGADAYSSAEKLLPLFAEVKWSLRPSDKPIVFYGSLSGGYGFALTNSDYNIDRAQGGWMLSPALGFSNIEDPGYLLSFDLGLRWQKMYYERNFSEDYSERIEILFQRLTLRFGLTFWLKKD